MGNALALSTGCPHGPQGAGRSEGLVHNCTGRGLGVGRGSGGDRSLLSDAPEQLPPGPVQRLGGLEVADGVGLGVERLEAQTGLTPFPWTVNGLRYQQSL